MMILNSLSPIRPLKIGCRLSFRLLLWYNDYRTILILYKYIAERSFPVKLSAIATTTCLAVALALFSGCTPEETYVAVDASALQKAVAGELAYAKVEMIFDIQSKNDPQLPNKIRIAALPYLGEGAVIELEKTEKRTVRAGGSIRDDDDEVEVDKSLDDAKLVARFTIPVGTENALRKAPKSIMWLRYSPSDKMFCLVNGNNVSALNSALSDVSASVSYKFEGGTSSEFFGAGTTIRIKGDVAGDVGVAAVSVNGKEVIADTFKFEGKSLKIGYNNKFYADKAPCFVFGNSLRPIRPDLLKEKSAWE